MAKVLDQEQLDLLRDMLLARQRELLAELRADKADPVSVESESQGYEEAYLDSLGQQVDTEITAQHRIERHRIEAALRRMQEGTYGVCEDCDGQIGYARLQAFPTARLCIECKQASEQQNRSGA